MNLLVKHSYAEVLMMADKQLDSLQLTVAHLLTCFIPLGATFTVLSLVESMRQLTSICILIQAICNR